MRTEFRLTLLVVGLWGSTLALVQSQPYTFITWAGSVGYGTADGTNGQAQFDYPLGIAADPAGNLYVADSNNGTIRKLRPSGTNWVTSTLAGTPLTTGSADGTNGSAQFDFPGGVAADQAGNVYVADSYNYTIRKVSPEGVVTTLAGSPGEWGDADGTGSEARFDEAYGIAVDNVGNVYVADTYNYTIRRLSPVGTNWVVTTLAGSAGIYGSTDGTNSDARFDYPNGLAVDTAGNIYVGDAGNNVIRKITPVGTNWVVTTLAGLAGEAGSADGTNSQARFESPEGVALDGAGNLYVADAYNNTIRQLTPVGTNWVVSTLAGLAGEWGSADGLGDSARFDYPASLALVGGDIYVADGYNNTVRRMTPVGTNWMVTTALGVASIGSKDATGRLAQFYYPNGVAAGTAGDVYVTDGDNNTIRKITAAGAVSTLAGSPRLSGSADGTGSDARFDLPWGVAVDAATNVYVGDYYNHTIRKLSPVGSNWVVTTLAGSPGVSGSTDGTSNEALFHWPAGLAVDGAGNVLVADAGNQTIRRITPAGMVSTLAGLAGSRGSADGMNSDARFYTPVGIALGNGGNLFVAEYNNHTIRKVAPIGADWVVSTVAGLAGSRGGADGTNNAARFNYPGGVAVDGAGNLYIADSNNHTIRKITPVGPDWVVTTLGQPAGTWSGHADGTGSAAAFDYPRGIAVDGGGNLYVADTYNNMIRKGVPASAAAPRLNLLVVGDQVVLSWPLSAGGFVLETETALASGAEWSARTNGISLSSEGFSLTELKTVQPAFYRLHKP